LVARTVDAGPPVRVSYALTEQGRAFGEVARAVERWGHELVRSEGLREKKTIGVRAHSG
jgi:DNA-binding HxlR family transcriptional regulator